MISDREIGNAIPFFRFIADECEKTGIRFSFIELPWLVLGIGSRESGWGTARAYVDVDGVPDGDIGDGVGDHGHGRGLMQIDDRWHAKFVATGLWKIPEQNIKYAIQNVLVPNYRWLARKHTDLDDFDLMVATIASYNCGAGNVRKALRAGISPDEYTTGKNYAADVIRRAQEFRQRFVRENLMRLVPPPPHPLT